MNSEKPGLETTTLIDGQVTAKGTATKKKKKAILPPETLSPSPGTGKTDPETKATAKAMDLKAPKAEKLKAPKAEKLVAPKPEKLKAPKVEKLKAPMAEKLKVPKAEKLKAPKAEKLVAPKAEKLKAPKAEKLKAAKEDKLKAPKDDKPTKFMVSMKKSVRKSIKKEAADVGVSMNEYIVLAVTEKLDKGSIASK